jgi:FtsH-binding integral membrane protein
MGFSSEVWDRRNERADHTMSKNLYAFMVSGLTFLGIFASLGSAQITHNLKFQSGWGLAGFLIGVLAVALIGTTIAMKSNNPAVSFLGYMLVAIPFGLMLGPVVAQYTTASVVKVFFITTIIVAVLGVVGAVIPDNLEGFGSWLLAALLVLLVGYFIVPIAGYIGFNIGGALTVLDWVGVVIFSGMVVFDWNRAMHLPRTADNAIDSALAVYLDWFNIFIRLLSLTGQRTSND